MPCWVACYYFHQLHQETSGSRSGKEEPKDNPAATKTMHAPASQTRVKPLMLPSLRARQLSATNVVATQGRNKLLWSSFLSFIQTGFVSRNDFRWRAEVTVAIPDRSYRLGNSISTHLIQKLFLRGSIWLHMHTYLNSSGLQCCGWIARLHFQDVRNVTQTLFYQMHRNGKKGTATLLFNCQILGHTEHFCGTLFLICQNTSYAASQSAYLMHWKKLNLQKNISRHLQQLCTPSLCILRALW